MSSVLSSGLKITGGAPISRVESSSVVSSGVKMTGGAPKGGRKKSQPTIVQPCPILVGQKRNRKRGTRETTNTIMKQRKEKCKKCIDADRSEKCRIILFELFESIFNTFRNGLQELQLYAVQISRCQQKLAKKNSEISDFSVLNF